MNEPEVSIEIAKQFGLTAEEYGKILLILQRNPTYTELGIFSVMWSEHCCYKNSILLLKTLPKEGSNVLAKAGEENAGLIDIGNGLAVAFKIESHNHPSAIEPYQGAATGVGGIHRDIFTMGARPVASLNSLRFGSLTEPRTKSLLTGVVKGIGDYGNAFGVPTVAGEIYFDECYSGNPLVNAMSVGILEIKNMARAIAEGVGNPVFIVGSKTGRDGIHGATFASEEISENSQSKRPNVQVGDPFMEKLLLEATLEAIQTGHIVGIQDMGAAGLTCSSSEMTAKGLEKHNLGGMEINLDKVPIREDSMSGYEIMLSESQERMLLVVKKGKEKEILNIFHKWEVSIAEIGVVTNSGKLIVKKDNKVIADIPPISLVLGGDAPVYERQYERAASSTKFPTLKEDAQIDFSKIIVSLLSSPNIANKRWVYEQYDSMVQTNTITTVGASDSAVIRIKGTNKGLAMKVDCNSKYVYLNPRKGAMIAIAECARNIACSGAVPLGVTNCLNFGNPYKPNVYYQFRESVLGIGDACRFFELPVTGGNVSFYNETQTKIGNQAVYPTPTIGMVGVIDDISAVVPSAFQEEGDCVFLIGDNILDLNGSEFIKHQYGELGTDAPYLNLETEKKLHTFLKQSAKEKILQSAHDVSEGGLMIALIESSILNTKNQLGVNVNFTLDTTSDKQSIQKQLFSETQGMIVISTTVQKKQRVMDVAKSIGLPMMEIGIVKKEVVAITINQKPIYLDLTKTLSEIYYTSFETIVNS